MSDCGTGWRLLVFRGLQWAQRVSAVTLIRKSEVSPSAPIAPHGAFAFMDLVAH